MNKRKNKTHTIVLPDGNIIRRTVKRNNAGVEYVSYKNEIYIVYFSHSEFVTTTVQHEVYEAVSVAVLLPEYNSEEDDYIG